jgi:hypothetical protein
MIYYNKVDAGDLFFFALSPMPNQQAPYTTSPSRMPHPEVYMDYVHVQAFFLRSKVLTIAIY